MPSRPVGIPDPEWWRRGEWNPPGWDKKPAVATTLSPLVDHRGIEPRQGG